ncbi:PREDICTED: 28 kDa heat- and acid-stable phosphoprotein-like [Drosophila arizonae]|uniref:28 kDa heat- and acid-stable phosphoprotein-like n=1 Tax=Drosophila arizonae TaxID=7263 RepID=A0ABM1PX20_DROAR|nr:PREDICTED: 28 kDa heat- and acid-stable phosphoprotein-like [Drosophila arizonae]
MPRGKYPNHKGRSRQFTPVEELQRERELEVCIMSSQLKKLNTSSSSLDSVREGGNNSDKGSEIGNLAGRVNGNSNNSSKSSASGKGRNGTTKGRKLGGAVEGLIEISNPNRPIKKSQKLALLNGDDKGKTTDDTLLEKRRRERAREKPRSNSNQKTASEASADLARLAIVRKKREEAAEQRLAAKRESNNPSGDGATPNPSKSDIFIKKKNNKHKSATMVGGTNEFLKKPNTEENVSKFLKGGRHGNKLKEGTHKHLKEAK